jgi:uncharacterized protein
MDDLPAPRARPCPICGKPMVAAFRPFCSSRCRTIDLGRWLDDRYGIPAEENEDGPSDDEEK